MVFLGLKNYWLVIFLCHVIVIVLLEQLSSRWATRKKVASFGSFTFILYYIILYYIILYIKSLFWQGPIKGVTCSVLHYRRSCLLDSGLSLYSLPLETSLLFPGRQSYWGRQSWGVRTKTPRDTVCGHTICVGWIKHFRHVFVHYHW